MISPPTLLVQCDQMVTGQRLHRAGITTEQCRRSEAMTIAMSLDGTPQQLRALFLAPHRDWWISVDGTVYCPQCATIALARVKAQTAEVGGA